MKPKLTKKQISILCLMGIIITAAGFILFQHISLLYGLDAEVLDDYIFITGERQPHDDLVIIVVDDESMRKSGNDRTILRNQYVKLIKKLTMAEVKAIVFDIFLSDLLDNKIDSQLAHVTDSSDKVIHSYYFPESGTIAEYDVGNEFKKYAIQAENIEKLVPFSAHYANFPAEKLMKAFDHAGHVSYECDADGKTRRIPLFYKFDGLYYPALALTSVLKYFNIPENSVKIETGFWGHFVVFDTPQESIRIPVNSRGQVLLNYYGIMEIFKPRSMYNTIKLLELLCPAELPLLPLPEFKEKIVLIGITELNGFDSHITPFSADFPGVGIHATLISNILKGDFIIEAPWYFNVIVVSVLNLFLFGIFLYYLEFSKSRWLFGAMAIGIIILFDFMTYAFLFKNFGIWLKTIQINMTMIIFLLSLLYYERGILLKIPKGKMVKKNNDQDKNEVEAKKEIGRKLTKLSIPTVTRPAPEKIVREINAAYQFYRSQVRKGQLQQFFIDGTVAVREFLNDRGEVIPTEMGKIFKEIKNISQFESTVLITGESGTGKNLIAQAIHKKSQRKNEKMIILNCSSIPESLMESELFGHEKGAFTGATNFRKGAFKSADRGTIFLDEIGLFKLDLQAKLLRAIDNKEIQRLGSDEAIQVDVRIIAATNKNLKKAIENEEFLRDLYYRLNVINIHLPPLRERKTDIPFLIHHFLAEFNTRNNRNKFFSSEAIIAAMCYDWPGNIRELKNFVESACVKGAENLIDFTALPDEIQTAYRKIFASTAMPVWQQIEEMAHLEKQNLLKNCKIAIRTNRIEEFLTSSHLAVQQETQSHCYDFFIKLIIDKASIFPHETREKLAKKMIVDMYDELVQWRSKDKIDSFEEVSPKIEKILGRTRRQINYWKKALGYTDRTSI